jgi:hypothetical protein
MFSLLVVGKFLLFFTGNFVGSNNDYMVTHGCGSASGCSSSTVEVFKISNQLLTVTDLTALFSVYARATGGSDPMTGTVPYGKYLLLINWFKGSDQSLAIPVFDTILGTWAVYSGGSNTFSFLQASSSFWFFDSVVLAARDSYQGLKGSAALAVYGSLPGFSSNPLLTLPATACAATLAGSSLMGSTTCSACGNGRYASQFASSRACEDCAAGTYAQGAVSTCPACGGGTWSNSASSSCFTCPTGSPGPACSACQSGSENKLCVCDVGSVVSEWSLFVTCVVCLCVVCVCVFSFI